MSYLNSSLWALNVKDEVPYTVFLNDRLYNDLRFMITSTAKAPKKETGGFLIRNLAGKLGIIAITQGETKEIHIEDTEGLNKGEKYIGSFHTHTHKPLPSVHDIATFLASEEQIMVVGNYDGTINVVIKGSETKKVDDVEWFKEQYYEKDSSEEQKFSLRVDLANAFVYLHYIGNINEGKELNLISKSVLNIVDKSVDLDDLASNIKGVDSLPEIPTKKSKW